MQRGHYSFRHRDTVADAVPEQLKPGARAGNPLIDLNEASLCSEVGKSIRKLQKSLAKQSPQFTAEVDRIIKDLVRDPKIIEATLDLLLDRVPLGFGEDDFKRLNHYYASVSKRGSRAYAKFLKEALEL